MREVEATCHHMAFQFELRDYQKDFCRKSFDAFYKGVDGGDPVQTALSVAATGAGKTIMAAALAYSVIRHKNERVLFLADTDELVEQARDKMVDAAGLKPDIEKAQARASKKAKIVVGSIQTLARQNRLDEWDPDHFGMVIADEAHLSMAKSWQRVLNYFKDGGAKILGITATPERGDGKNLFKFYDCIPYEIRLFDLIEKGHLSPITVQSIPLDVDTTGIKSKRMGELDSEDVDHAMQPYLDAIIDAWQEHASDRKTLVFHPNIRMSKEFDERLIRRGIKSRHIDGTSKNRKEILLDYQKGKFDILNNALLLTKGYDCPDIECVIVLRPTKSRVAYQQMVGRGTRTAPDKDDCLLLDFLYQFEDLGAIRPAALAARGDEIEAAMQKQINSFGKGKQGKLNLQDLMSECEIATKQALIDKFKEKSKKGAKTYDAREMAGILDEPDLLEYKPTNKWELDPPTSPQLEMLERVGINPFTVKTKGEASAIIAQITERRRKKLATPKQVAFLQQRGHAEAHAMTFVDASDKIRNLTGGFGRRKT